jgi:thioredoxin reductase (NADPH)
MVMGLIETRGYQMFPVLDAGQIETAKRFASGPPRDFAPGDTVFAVGERNVPSWLVLKGAIDAIGRDGRGVETHITTHHAGQFSGELSQLAGRQSLAMGKAGPEGATAIPFDDAHVRALMIGSAEIGEIMMRAFILRRVGLIEEGKAGSALIGTPGNPDLARIEGFLARNGYPYKVLDPAEDSEAAALLDRAGVEIDELPVMFCPNGQVLRRPNESEAAACLGILPNLDLDKLYDVAVVGAGPAGLAAAVYAASEGLSVMVFDTRAFGGQAGASARIENYFGFPTGINGMKLTARGFNQALKFGAEVAIPLTVEKLDCGGQLTRSCHSLKLELDNGKALRARTVVIASGARYRRLSIANLSDFEGAGVSFWATSVERNLCEGQEVALVGGGNSAGQAVVFLAEKVKHLYLVIRRDGLEATMSKYLIDRIKALPNVTLCTDTEVVGLEGEAHKRLTAATFKNTKTGEEERCELNQLFLFCGADPNTDWLDGCVAVDAKGFVTTGAGFDARTCDGNRPVLPLETSWPGVFAIGDVRAGSTKRVAAAVGEGAAVVAQIHRVLGAE